MFDVIHNLDGYKYQVLSYQDDDYPEKKYYLYKIYENDVDCNQVDKSLICISPDMFETYWEARFAAIGYIETMKKESRDDSEGLCNS